MDSLSSSHPDIEIITHPNNPDFEMRSKSTTARFQLYDHVYYWPMYLNITHQVAYDDSAVAVFSLSKMAGLASSRVGWVITSNTQVAAFIRRWSMITHISQPIQSHMIAALSIEHIISSGGLIFEEMKDVSCFEQSVLMNIGSSYHDASFRVE